MGGPSTPRIPRLLSLRAVAELTTIPRSTLYTLVANGELPAVRIGDGNRRGIRIREDRLRQWIDERTERAS